ncbi:hypothetical protein GEMRC1_003679 [Eukaryota sp. GEM-RC1]
MSHVSHWVKTTYIDPSVGNPALGFPHLLQNIALVSRENSIRKLLKHPSTHPNFVRVHSSHHSSSFISNLSSHLATGFLFGFLLGNADVLTSPIPSPYLQSVMHRTNSVTSSSILFGLTSSLIHRQVQRSTLRHNSALNYTLTSILTRGIASLFLSSPKEPFPILSTKNIFLSITVGVTQDLLRAWSDSRYPVSLLPSPFKLFKYLHTISDTSSV